jgi:general stress protein 26
MDLDAFKDFSTKLSPWAHIATTGGDGEPDVVPVHPCWDGDTLWFMGGADSVKGRNVAHNNKVALHWQVTENGNGAELWGTCEVFTDVETKRRLWTGVFDYDLNAFSPGGPDESEGTGFFAVTPTRALIVNAYGIGGLDRWKA